MPKDRKRAWHVRKSMKYIAEYDAAAKKSVLFYYPEIIPGKAADVNRVMFQI